MISHQISFFFALLFFNVDTVMQSLTKFILFQDDVATKMGKYSDKNMRSKHKRKANYCEAHFICSFSFDLPL